MREQGDRKRGHGLVGTGSGPRTYRYGTINQTWVGLCLCGWLSEPEPDRDTAVLAVEKHRDEELAMNEQDKGGRGSQNEQTIPMVPEGYAGPAYMTRTFADMTSFEVATCLEDAITVLNDQNAIQDYFLEADMSIDMPWNERAADFLAWLASQS